MRQSRLSILLTTLLLLSSVLAGCTSNDGGNETADQNAGDTGNDDGTNGTADPEVVDIQVGLTGLYPATIAYDPAEITVESGTMVNLTFTNNDQNPAANHDWAVEIDGEVVKTDVVANGESASVEFMAPAPGEYTFYCSVPGHRDYMEGTLIVTGDASSAGGNETAGNGTSGNQSFVRYH